MQIDWFTVAAEIVNFLILVFLLKKILYDRIIGVAEAREEQIAQRYAEAEEQQQTAEEEAATYRQKRQEIEEQRQTLLEEARAEADERRQELLREARTAVDQQEETWRQALAREQDRFLKKLRQRTGQQVYAIAEKTLADLADVDLEEQVISVFLSRVQQLEDEQRAKILDSLQDNRAELQTAFALPQEQQQKLIEGLQTELTPEIEPRFTVDQELVCGLALRVNGQQVTWNIHNYLDHLEEQVQETLAQKPAGRTNN